MSRPSSKKSRTAAGSSSSSRPAENHPPMPQDTMGIRFVLEEQRQRYAYLHNRTHLVTKFVDVDILEQFGLINGIRTLLENGGLGNFITKAAKSYPRLTTEFLCTLQDMESNPPSVSFRAFNKSYTLTHADIADAFGWTMPPAGEEWQLPSETVLSRFWSESTGRPYQREANKVWMLAHPALRYTYRLMSMTIFLRGEPTGVSLAELGCLYALMKSDGGHPNWVDLFLGKCFHLQNSKSGKLSMGGMVTLLVEKCGVRIPQSCASIQSRASIYYDWDGLKMTKFFTIYFDYPHYVINQNERGTQLPTHVPNYYDITPDATPHSLYRRAMGLPDQEEGDVELHSDDEDADMAEAREEDEDEDEDYNPAEETELPERNETATASNEWQSTMDTRVGRLESQVHSLDERFQSFEDRYDEDMYDITTHLKVLRIAQQAQVAHLAGFPFVDPLEDIQQYEDTRTRRREGSLRRRREARRNRFSSSQAGPSTQ